MHRYWKPFFDGRYAVSSLNGDVVNLKTRRKLKPDIVRGYKQITVSIFGKAYRFKVHRLVLQVFVGSCPAGYVSHHKDNNKGNNSLKNLAYIPRKENSTRAAVDGCYVVGQDHYRSRLTDVQVLEIRRRYTRGNGAALGREFRIDRATVNHIISRRTWKHI